jgi:hypothetical protein
LIVKRVGHNTIDSYHKSTERERERERERGRPFVNAEYIPNILRVPSLCSGQNKRVDGCRIGSLIVAQHTKHGQNEYGGKEEEEGSRRFFFVA